MERLPSRLLLATALALAVAAPSFAQDAPRNVTTELAPATTVAMPVEVDVPAQAVTPAQEDVAAQQ